MTSPSRSIALEEHFWIPATRAHYSPESVCALERVSRGLLGDVGAERIQRMDDAGIDLQVLSHVSPGAQGV